jgi:hypothetical protein
MSDAIAVLNAGSSSLKFSLFAERGNALELTVRGHVEGLYTAPRFVAKDRHGKILGEKSWGDGVTLGHDGALDHLVAFLRAKLGEQPSQELDTASFMAGSSTANRFASTRRSCRRWKSTFRSPLCISRTTWRQCAPYWDARRNCLRSLASIPHSTMPSPRWHRPSHSRDRSPTAA